MNNVVFNKQFKFKKLEHTTGRNPFGIVGKEDNIVEVVYHSNECDATLLCRGGIIHKIDSSYITNNIELFNKYKVIISKSAGDPEKDRNVIGRPCVAGPGVACTDTFITIGKFGNQQEAENLAKYIKTKFLRYMVSILKISQNTYQIVYQFVPNQDFTNNSDIDWTQPISNIDQQLYDKYHLNTLVIDQTTGQTAAQYIEGKISSME